MVPYRILSPSVLVQTCVDICLGSGVMAQVRCSSIYSPAIHEGHCAQGPTSLIVAMPNGPESRDLTCVREKEYMEYGHDAVQEHTFPENVYFFLNAVGVDLHVGFWKSRELGLL